MAEIDYKLIFDNLDTFLNIPIKRKGRRWAMSSYIDLSPHKRHDKTVFYLNKANIIVVQEQGGDVMSLYNWLLKYSPDCTSPRDVFNKLNDGSGFSLPIDSYYKKIAERELLNSRYVEDKWVDRLCAEENRRKSNLFNYLSSIFGLDKVTTAFDLYRVGCIGKSSIIFWYIDGTNICHDNRISYLPNGKRDKSTHAYRKFTIDSGFNKHCLFGKHLLKRADQREIYVVESEKTAIVMSICFPECVWLASGGKNQLANYVRKSFFLLPDYEEDTISLWRKKGNVVEWWNEFKNLKWKSPVVHGNDILDKILELYG